MTSTIPLQAILIAIAIHALWGGNPVAVKFSLLAFPPMWTGFLRFAIAIVCIALWAWMRRIRIWPSSNEWPSLLVLGLLFTVQIATMNIGFDNTSGAMGSVLISTNPIFAAIVAHFVVANDRMHTAKAIGLVISLAGVGVVLLHDVDLQTLDLGSVGNWIVLFSAALLGLRLAISARILSNIDPVRVAIWQMAISLPLFAAGGLMWESIAWDRISWPAAAGLAYQGLIVAGLGFMVSFHLMKRYTPSVMMSFNFVSPIAGVLLSVWLLSESVGVWLLAGMALVGFGLYLIAKPVQPAKSA